MDLYSNKDVRRQDRLLDEKSAMEIIKNEEYGFLAMVETREELTAGYGIPISYVWDNDKHIYIHCAPEGYKFKCINEVPYVCLTIVGKTRVIPEKFTTNYQSVVIRGIITRGLSDEEKWKGIRLILEKYCPNDIEVGLKYAKNSFGRTEILRLDIDSISGKCKDLPIAQK